MPDGTAVFGVCLSCGAARAFLHLHSRWLPCRVAVASPMPPAVPNLCAVSTAFAIVFGVLYTLQFASAAGRVPCGAQVHKPGAASHRGQLPHGRRPRAAHQPTGALSSFTLPATQPFPLLCIFCVGVFCPSDFEWMIRAAHAHCPIICTLCAAPDGKALPPQVWGVDLVEEHLLTWCVPQPRISIWRAEGSPFTIQSGSP